MLCTAVTHAADLWQDMVEKEHISFVVMLCTCWYWCYVLLVLTCVFKKKAFFGSYAVYFMVPVLCTIGSHPVHVWQLTI